MGRHYVVVVSLGYVCKCVSAAHCFASKLRMQTFFRVERDGADAPWQQTMAVAEPASDAVQRNWRQVLQPVTDVLIQRCLDAMVSKHQLAPKSSWLHRLMSLASGQGEQQLRTGRIPPVAM